jgi:hypothetical protein
MNRRCRLLGFLALAVLFGAAARSGERASPICRRVPFEQPPGWVNSAVWMADGQELAINDVTGGRILRYSKDGRFLGAIGRPENVQGDYKPAQLHATPEGLLVRNRASDWLWLDRQLKPTKKIGQEGPPRFAMVDEVLVGDDVIGFGTRRKADQSWIFGIQRIRLNPLRPLEIIDEVQLTSKAGTLYTALNSTVAIAGGVPYALRFAEPSYLLNLTTRSRLKAFPAGFEELPVLPAATGPDSDVPRARVLEKAKLPVALYGSGALLYLLTRQPDADGKTVWRLHRIDPVKDRLIGSITLPTSAAKLELAPGKDIWAILEKAPQKASAQQDVISLLLVPAITIEKGDIVPSCR